MSVALFVQKVQCQNNTMPIYNLEQIFIFECCQEQMITSKRIKLQTSNTTHLKENFKTFLTLIWFLYLHVLDIEKKNHFS